MKNHLIKIAIIINIMLAACMLFGWIINNLSAANQIVKAVDSSSARWDKAFANILKEEGVYSNDPSDPGGETKYGISKNSYPHLNIKTLTKEQAGKIYKEDYWEPIKGDHLHDDALAVEVMEEAVNMGASTAVSFLQIAVMVCGGKIAVDGKMGHETLQEIRKHDPKVLLACIKAQSLSYYKSLVLRNPVLRKFLKGWFNRVLV